MTQPAPKLHTHQDDGPCQQCWMDQILYGYAQFERIVPNSGCPCLVIEPCHERCTCVHPHSSRGCQRCARYGSREQREAAARRIASAVDDQHCD